MSKSFPAKIPFFKLQKKNLAEKNTLQRNEGFQACAILKVSTAEIPNIIFLIGLGFALSKNEYKVSTFFLNFSEIAQILQQGNFYVQTNIKVLRIMIFGKLFYVVVIVLSFGGLWKILGPTPTHSKTDNLTENQRTS
jgi:hypothetical protein